MDANRGSSSVALLNVDSVDVDDPLLPVDLDTKTVLSDHFHLPLRAFFNRLTNLGDLALSALVLSSDNQNLVVLPDGDGSGLSIDPFISTPFLQASKTIIKRATRNQTHVVLLSELLGQGGRHELPLEAGRGREVRLARLAAVRSEAYPFKSVSVYPNQNFEHLIWAGPRQGTPNRQAGRQADAKGARGYGTGGLHGVVEPLGGVLTKVVLLVNWRCILELAALLKSPAATAGATGQAGKCKCLSMSEIFWAPSWLLIVSKPHTPQRATASLSLTFYLFLLLRTSC